MADATPTRGSLAAWVRAARPLAQANVAPPLLLGQALALREHGSFGWGWLALVHLFGVLDQLFILFVNDLSDLEADRHNEHPTAFSGGSRVLVEGRISPRAMGRAAGAVLALLGGACAALFALERPLATPLTAAGVLLVWAYSLPPVRLAYRGHGELLQAAGVGVVLPLFGFYLQAGTLQGFPPGLLAAAMLLGYAGNVATSLPDEPADRAVGKRTYAVRVGFSRARAHSLALSLAACVALPLGAGLAPIAALTCVAISAAPLALAAKLGAAAVPGEKGSMQRYLIALGASFTLCWLSPTAWIVATR